MLDLAGDRTFLIDRGDSDVFNPTSFNLDIVTSADDPDVPVFLTSTLRQLVPGDTNDRTDLYAVSLDLLANDDTASVNEGETVRIDVLANDIDADGNGIDLAGFRPEPTATLAIDDNGTPGDASDDALLLTPGDGFVDGTEVFYTITDDAGAKDTGRVTVALLAGGEDDLVVTTTADVIAQDGELSLREAVRAANAREGADTITFADDLKGATLLLDGGPLTITDDLTIDGDAADGGVGGVTLVQSIPSLPIVGDREPGFISVESGVRVGLEDLTITDEGLYNTFRRGLGGLYGDQSDISLDRVRVADIFQYAGARGVYVKGGTLAVSDSIFENIRGSDGTGNGIEATDGASVSIARTALSDIGGTYYGFAVDVEGTLDLADSAITNISGSDSSNGVRVDGTFDIINTTIAGVRATGGFGYDPVGGAGINVLAGSTGTITNATIAGNIVGAGIAVAEGAELRLENSVAAENYQFQNLFDTPIGNEENLILKDVVGTIESNGGNVFSQDAVDGAAGGDVLGADPGEVFADFRTVFDEHLARRRRQRWPDPDRGAARRPGQPGGRPGRPGHGAQPRPARRGARRRPRRRRLRGRRRGRSRHPPPAAPARSRREGAGRSRPDQRPRPRPAHDQARPHHPRPAPLGGGAEQPARLLRRRTRGHDRQGGDFV